MKTKILLLLTVFALGAFVAGAQSVKYSDVLLMRVRDQGTIVENNAIKGYYFFYNVERADRKNNNYLLRVLDENLRQVNEVTITRPTTYTLLESAYNGSAFAFVFLDYKNKTIEILSFDKSCKQIGTKKLTDLTRRELYAYASVAEGEENTTATIFAVRGKGFVRVNPDMKEKLGYDVEMLDDNLKSVWKSSSSATTKKWLIPTMLDINETHVLLEISELDGAMDKDYTYKLQCIDLATGKDAFYVTLDDAKFKLAGSNASFDETNSRIAMLGEYYAMTEKTASGKSLGFYAAYMDMTGQFTEKKFLSWEKDVSKLIAVNEKGKLDNKAYIFFHKITRLADGKIYAIGEQFKKAASGIGIASAVLNGGNTGVSTVKIVTMNMMVFQFDPQLNLTAVKVFEKDPSNVLLPKGAGMVAPALLARYVKYLDMFDYVYTQKSSDNARFTTTYVNYDREKGQKPVNTVGAIIYADDKFTEDHIPLAKAKTSYGVYPAKPGYILISEYSRKEKTLDVHLEKFNY